MPIPAALAPFASLAGSSRGRRFPEPESRTRSAFQRDRDRIIHSTAFRRLQYKTQVFVYYEGDHYRTRLTHSLEVSQIARSVCRVLGFDSDLAEALALAHDLGHTPFGHAGEEVLDRAMAAHGGFDHNAQTLRILTRLERRYAAFDGLNLSWETLEGTVKHNGPVDTTGEVPAAILEYDREHDLALDTWPGPEAQVASLADDIAYNYHDLDDGVRAELFTLETAAEVPVVGEVLAEVDAEWPDLEVPRRTHEVVRRLIGLTVDDVLAESRRRIAEATPATVEAVRRLGRPLICFSPAMQETDRRLKAFLGRNMYRHERVAQRSKLASEVVSGLFEMYTAEPGQLPPEWRAAAGVGATLRARTVADFIAGMTDRFALQEYRRLTGVDADV
jgi:dGTPase